MFPDILSHKFHLLDLNNIHLNKKYIELLNSNSNNVMGKQDLYYSYISHSIINILKNSQYMIDGKYILYMKKDMEYKILKYLQKFLRDSFQHMSYLSQDNNLINKLDKSFQLYIFYNYLNILNIDQSQHQNNNYLNND